MLLIVYRRQYLVKSCRSFEKFSFADHLNSISNTSSISYSIVYALFIIYFIFHLSIRFTHKVAFICVSNLFIIFLKALCLNTNLPTYTKYSYITLCSSICLILFIFMFHFIKIEIVKNWINNWRSKYKVNDGIKHYYCWLIIIFFYLKKTSTLCMTQ